MRAIFNREAELKEQLLIIEKEDLHHLLNVVRVRAGEELAILDGMGGKGIYHVQHITKEKIELKRLSLIMEERTHRISLLIGVPKKEYLEDIYRTAIQLGVNEIYLWESKNSQKHLQIKPDRLEKILKGAYEQSNNPFEIKIKSFDEIDLEFFDYRVLMTVTGENDSLSQLKGYNAKLPTLLAIGPEGGFTAEEEQELRAKGFKGLKLATPILKATQAVPTGVGVLVGASMVDAI